MTTMRAAITSSLCGMLLVACSGAPEAVSKPERPVHEPDVSVALRTIGPVLTISGSVVPTPSLLVSSVAAGTVAFDVRAGANVERGQRLATVDGKAVTAPAAGWVEALSVPDGAAVEARVPVLEMRTSGFAVSAEMSSSDAKRFAGQTPSARTQIENGPGPEECQPAEPGEGQESADGDSRPVLCLLRPGLDVSPGMPALLALSFASSERVPSLPTTAVAGSFQTGLVAKVESGRVRTVKVGLGTSDGTTVQITSGLEVGDTVRATAPTIEKAAGSE
jgi:macrolide-specific efflux system membrane fusion protein